MKRIITQERASKPYMAVVYFFIVFSLSSLALLGESFAYLSTVLMLAVIFYIGVLKGTFLKEIGLNKPDSWSKTIGLGILYAVVIFLLFRITLEPLLETITGTERDISRFDYLKGNTTALMSTIIVLWIAAGFVEEVLYRGFLITNIASIFNSSNVGHVIAILLSSTLFALAHGYQGIGGMLLTGFAAIFFSLVFLFHKRNLWIVIIAHGITDSSAAVFLYLDVYEEVSQLLFK